MPFNINQFKSSGLVGGGARPSLFDVEIIGHAGLDNLRFLARSTQLPAMTMQSVDVPYFGRKIKVQGDRTFADWSITIMNDEDFKLRAAFEAWSNKMNTIISNVNTVGNNPNSYKGEAIVRQYSKAGKSNEEKPIRAYKFVGIFPTQIDAINLDWETTNSIETFDVTFAYDFWEPYETSKTNTGATDYSTTDTGKGYTAPGTLIGGNR
jgi:hypothetical protein